VRDQAPGVSQDCRDLDPFCLWRHIRLESVATLQVRDGLAARAAHDQSSGRGCAVWVENDAVEHDRQEGGAALVIAGRHGASCLCENQG